MQHYGVPCDTGVHHRQAGRAVQLPPFAAVLQVRRQMRADIPVQVPERGVNDEMPARFEVARQLADETGRIGNVFQHIEAHNDVIAVERKLLRLGTNIDAHLIALEHASGEGHAALPDFKVSHLMTGQGESG